jgi:hypothetical protein
MQVCGVVMVCGTKSVEREGERERSTEDHLERLGASGQGEITLALSASFLVLEKEEGKGRFCTPRWI